jgi:hypothetical protein
MNCSFKSVHSGHVYCITVDNPNITNREFLDIVEPRLSSYFNIPNIEIVPISQAAEYGNKLLPNTFLLRYTVECNRNEIAFYVRNSRWVAQNPSPRVIVSTPSPVAPLPRPQRMTRTTPQRPSRRRRPRLSVPSPLLSAQYRMADECIVCMEIQPVYTYYGCTHFICTDCFCRWNRDCPLCRQSMETHFVSSQDEERNQTYQTHIIS